MPYTGFVAPDAHHGHYLSRRVAPCGTSDNGILRLTDKPGVSGIEIYCGRVHASVVLTALRPADARWCCSAVITVAHVAVVIFIIIAGFTQVSAASKRPDHTLAGVSSIVVNLPCGAQCHRMAASKC